MNYSAGSEQVTDASYAFKLEKIQWYREILELEPGSKAFLPFARLLGEVGRTDEASSVLIEGLERHPEFTEARLFLIDILHKTGNEQLCRGEVARLAGMFCKYPDFWDAWSDFSLAQGDNRDLAISLSFLGALFKDNGLTLLDVLATGLGKAHSGELRPSAQMQGGGTEFTGVSSALFAPVKIGDEIGDEIGMAIPGGNSLPGNFSSDSANTLLAASLSAPFPSAGQSVQSTADERSDPKKCSLRTRSMAAVLAEQGDLRGAIEIYEELLNKEDLPNRDEIEAEVENLRARLGDEGNQPIQLASASSTPKNIALPQRNGMLDLLEKLAVRLETKARQ